MLRKIGLLRLIAALIALATLPALRLQHVETLPWQVIFGAALPGIAFFLIWAIPFDALLARLLMGDASGARHERLRIIVRFDAVIWILMLLTWGHFFWQLASDRLQ